MSELVEEVEVTADVGSVWQDFADADALATWIWPPRLETTASVDPQPGGAWLLRSDVGQMAVVGTVMTVDEPTALSLAWRWEGEDHATHADITLEPRSDSVTLVRVRHSGFASAEEHALHVQGWADCLQRLVERHR